MIPHTFQAVTVAEQYFKVTTNGQVIANFIRILCFQCLILSDRKFLVQNFVSNVSDASSDKASQPLEPQRNR